MKKEKKIIENIEEKLEIEQNISENIAQNIPEEDSVTAPISSFPSHFSPFPSASATTSSLPLSRPFQAVIFADDEMLAVSVCDTVRTLLNQIGKNESFCHSNSPNSGVLFLLLFPYFSSVLFIL